ncbi:hypothetical protein PAPYR_2553 [Paratrimastix pyriformis]|uniref:VWFA domain-containing protein n=1 Tax=Paratrimastix pyriformis TaxID=342808 RepID=A0ABQ8UU78_9EUKA|nr:hypothetical protein PAPYR_2553 [Paratrimastix pyriformis]
MQVPATAYEPQLILSSPPRLPPGPQPQFLNLAVEAGQVPSAGKADEGQVAIAATLSARVLDQVTVQPHLDLIALVDTSRSMSGETLSTGRSKLIKVKACLEQALLFLRTGDRFSVILFANNVKVLFPLTEITALSKVELVEKLCDEIDHPDGGTNIMGALQAGLEEIARSTIGPGTPPRSPGSSPSAVRTAQPGRMGSIWLFSDGMDSHVRQETTFIGNRAIHHAGITLNDVSWKVRELLGSFGPQVQEGVTIHTFGFGNGHDTVVLSMLAQVGRGSYFYVRDERDFPAHFATCLSARLSAVAKRVSIRIVPQNCRVARNLHLLQADPHTVELGDMYNEMLQTVLWQVQATGPNPQVTVVVTWRNIIQGRAATERLEQTVAFDPAALQPLPPEIHVEFEKIRRSLAAVLEANKSFRNERLTDRERDERAIALAEAALQQRSDQMRDSIARHLEERLGRGAGKPPTESIVKKLRVSTLSDFLAKAADQWRQFQLEQLARMRAAARDTAAQCRGEFQASMALWQQQIDQSHESLLARQRLTAEAMDELWRQALHTKQDIDRLHGETLEQMRTLGAWVADTTHPKAAPAQAAAAAAATAGATATPAGSSASPSSPGSPRPPTRGGAAQWDGAGAGGTGGAGPPYVVGPMEPLEEIIGPQLAAGAPGPPGRPTTMLVLSGGSGTAAYIAGLSGSDPTLLSRVRKDHRRHRRRMQRYSTASRLRLPTPIVPGVPSTFGDATLLGPDGTAAGSGPGERAAAAADDAASEIDPGDQSNAWDLSSLSDSDEGEPAERGRLMSALGDTIDARTGNVDITGGRPIKGPSLLEGNRLPKGTMAGDHLGVAKDKGFDSLRYRRRCTNICSLLALCILGWCLFLAAMNSFQVVTGFYVSWTTRLYVPSVQVGAAFEGLAAWPLASTLAIMGSHPINLTFPSSAVSSSSSTSSSFTSTSNSDFSLSPPPAPSLSPPPPPPSPSPPPARARASATGSVPPHPPLSQAQTSPVVAGAGSGLVDGLVGFAASDVPALYSNDTEFPLRVTQDGAFSNRFASIDSYTHREAVMATATILKRLNFQGDELWLGAMKLSGTTSTIETTSGEITSPTPSRPLPPTLTNTLSSPPSLFFAGGAITFRSAGAHIIFDGEVDANQHSIVNADRIQCNTLSFRQLVVDQLTLSGHTLASTALEGLILRSFDNATVSLIAVVEYHVAIVVTRVQFPADASSFFSFFPLSGPGSLNLSASGLASNVPLALSAGAGLTGATDLPLTAQAGNLLLTASGAVKISSPGGLNLGPDAIQLRGTTLTIPAPTGGVPTPMRPFTNPAPSRPLTIDADQLRVADLTGGTTGRIALGPGRLHAPGGLLIDLWDDGVVTGTAGTGSLVINGTMALGSVATGDLKLGEATPTTISVKPGAADLNLRLSPQAGGRVILGGDLDLGGNALVNIGGFSAATIAATSGMSAPTGVFDTLTVHNLLTLGSFPITPSASTLTVAAPTTAFSGGLSATQAALSGSLLFGALGLRAANSTLLEVAAPMAAFTGSVTAQGSLTLYDTTLYRPSTGVLRTSASLTASALAATSGALDLGPAATLRANSAGTVTLTGALVASQGLTSQTGVLTLNDVSWTRTAAGVLSAGTAKVIGGWLVASGGSLDLGSVTVRVSGTAATLTGSLTVTGALATQSSTVTIQDVVLTRTAAGALSTTGASLTASALTATTGSVDLASAQLRTSGSAVTMTASALTVTGPLTTQSSTVTIRDVVLTRTGAGALSTTGASLTASALTATTGALDLASAQLRTTGSAVTLTGSLTVSSTVTIQDVVLTRTGAGALSTTGASLTASALTATTGSVDLASAQLRTSGSAVTLTASALTVTGPLTTQSSTVTIRDVVLTRTGAGALSTTGASLTASALTATTGALTLGGVAITTAATAASLAGSLTVSDGLSVSASGGALSTAAPISSGGSLTSTAGTLVLGPVTLQASGSGPAARVLTVASEQLVVQGTQPQLALGAALWQQATAGQLDLTIGRLALSGALTVTGGEANLNGYTLSGAVTAAGTVTASGGTLALGGPATYSLTHTAAGTLTANGSLSLTGGLTVATTTALAGALTVAGTATVTGALAASSNLAVGGDAAVTGLVQAGTLAVGTPAPSLSYGMAAGVQGSLMAGNVLLSHGGLIIRDAIVFLATAAPATSGLNFHIKFNISKAGQDSRPSLYRPGFESRYQALTFRVGLEAHLPNGNVILTCSGLFTGTAASGTTPCSAYYSSDGFACVKMTSSSGNFANALIDVSFFFASRPDPQQPISYLYYAVSAVTMCCVNFGAGDEFPATQW